MSTLLYGYLAGWIVTSIALMLATRNLHRPTRPGSLLVAAAAGAAWPVLMLGAAQMAIVALVAEVVRRRASRDVSISEEQIDELVETLLCGVGAGRALTAQERRY